MIIARKKPKTLILIIARVFQYFHIKFLLYLNLSDLSLHIFFEKNTNLIKTGIQFITGYSYYQTSP